MLDAAVLVEEVRAWRDLWERAERLHAELPADVRELLAAEPLGMDQVVLPFLAAVSPADRAATVATLDALLGVLWGRRVRPCRRRGGRPAR